MPFLLPNQQCQSTEGNSSDPEYRKSWTFLGLLIQITLYNAYAHYIITHCKYSSAAGNAQWAYTDSLLLQGRLGLPGGEGYTMQCLQSYL